MTKVICNKALNSTKCIDCSGSTPHDKTVLCSTGLCSAHGNVSCLPVDEVINPEEIIEEPVKKIV